MTPALLFSVLMFAPPGTTTQALPAVTWAAAGPSYDGQHWGATVAGSSPINATEGVYGAVDWTFPGGKPAQAVSLGFYLQAFEWTWKGWDFAGHLLTLGGVTTLPTATLGNFTGGAHFGACRGSWCLGGAVRQITNPANAKQPRLYNVGVEWRAKP